MIQSREIHLVKRPQGLPGDECFELTTVDIPAIGDDEILVKNLWMTVDPYMRGRMNDVKSYVAPFALNETLEGEALGQVIESNHPDFAVGDIVESMLGWREYYAGNPDTLAKASGGIQKKIASTFPIQAYLGAAGMTGMTAYAGLMLNAQAKAGETVFVSGAAGAVGSIVCQIAKIIGCKVIGSAGSSEKVQWLKDVAGVDAAFNYKETSNIAETLAELAPEGIDVYFENVGGEHLSAAVANMNTYGRIALCGLISQYNTQTGSNVESVLWQSIAKEIRIQGFIVTSYYQHYPEYLELFSQWLSQGQLTWEETVVDGLENAPQAFRDLFSGKNLGKMLVKLCESE